MQDLKPKRAVDNYQGRLEGKINKLEETLRARRDVEKAIRILMELKNIEENDAYRYCATRHKPNAFRSVR
jgi:two-component system, response regulator PdtaR